ncbi:glycoside hydrolase family 16 protein [Nocardioides gilvus]|uniref:glycoside hydrolase family 16 protein n=1 Tax=Nocardioides gilvus TaxID=1735589 RepID=UPI0013A55580|nr:glycoside hydrolase family 16 protein [Nocardioides gilvus]
MKNPSPSSRLRSRSWAVAAVAAMAVSLATLPAVTAQAAPAKKVSATVKISKLGTQKANVAFKVRGKVSTKRVRRVALQVKKGNKYVTIKRAKTKRTGRFVFTNVKRAKTSRIRVVASRKVIGPKNRRKILLRSVSRSVRVKVTTTAAPAPVPSAPTTEVRWARLDKVANAQLPNTAFTVSGAVFSARVRTVHIERIVGKTQEVIAKGTSRADGTFTVSGVKLSSSAKLRVVAPAFRIATGKYGNSTRVIDRAESAAVDVKVTNQSASMVALPPIASAGASASAPTEGAVVSAKFTPARPGRLVNLEKSVNGSWVTVSTKPQDDSGHAVFQVAGTRDSYRATAVTQSDAPAMTTNSAATRGWAGNVDFEDTFDGNALDPKKWKHLHRPLGTGLRGCAQPSRDTFSVANGVLRMGVKKDPARAGQTCMANVDGKKVPMPYMLNTQIGTEGLYDFTYGFAAARVKVQKTKGMHSAFWAKPVNPEVNGQPQYGTEIDVFEYFGRGMYKENGVAAFIHAPNAAGTVIKTGAQVPETGLMRDGKAELYEEYHVYSVEWNASQYIFRIDGREFLRIKKDVSKAPEYLILSMLTSDWELPDLFDGVDGNIKDTATVDWVRVYKP